MDDWDGSRVMVAPFVASIEAERNVPIERAGFDVFPHRSRKCKCINSKRADMRRFTDADWQEIAEAEAEIDKTMFRPHRHKGAKFAAEVRKWANSERSNYQPPEAAPDAVESEDAPQDIDLLACGDTFGGCGS